MIYTDAQLKEKIVRMLASFENEVVEFKEARSNYHFNDIGKYFQRLAMRLILEGFRRHGLFLEFQMIRKLLELISENRVAYKI